MNAVVTSSTAMSAASKRSWCGVPGALARRESAELAISEALSSRCKARR
jgi:hypothetical protein